MSSRILFVDDEPASLDSYCAMLQSRFELDIAASGEQGLCLIRERGPYAVVFSDISMPVMDGIQFLSKVREIAPETVRVVITGCSSPEVAMAAVNEGEVFRFLSKPCGISVLTATVNQGIEHFHTTKAEHELLQQMLSAEIEVLVELLGLANPAAYTRTLGIRRCVSLLAAKHEVKEAWRFEVAAMLSQLGCVTLHPEVLDFVISGHPLSPSDLSAFKAHPMVARTLISKLPRMEAVSWIVAQQHGPMKGVPDAVDGMPREVIARGAEMLRLAIAHEDLLAGGLSHEASINALRASTEKFSPDLLRTLANLQVNGNGTEVRCCNVRDLVRGMIINEEVKTPTGLLIVAKGQELTVSLLERLRNFRERGAIKDPISVIVRKNRIEA
jgi:response regulator RpfG family c-di-GMP phosphodiesterase